MKPRNNTPIEELIQQYTEEYCDFTDLDYVKWAALTYVDTMADSQVRCLLYILANSIKEGKMEDLANVKNDLGDS